MKKELYVVQISSTNYAGAPEHCRVWAESEEDAMEAASAYANDFYYEQDADQWYSELEEDADTENWASIDHAVLQEGSVHEKYIADPKQAQNFYPIVN